MAEQPNFAEQVTSTGRPHGPGRVIHLSTHLHGLRSAPEVAVGHVILLAIHAPRLEQIVRMNPELMMALIRQLARMAAHDEKCSGAVALGPYWPPGKPFVRLPALVNSQEPGGVNASPSS